MREMVLWGSKNYRVYSGLFVLLKLKVKVSYEDIRKIVERALPLFSWPSFSSCLNLYVLARGPHGTGMGHPELILVSKDRT